MAEKVQNHLNTRHKVKRQQIADTGVVRKEHSTGPKHSGLGIKQLMQPLKVVSKGTLGKMAAWVCPFCKGEMAKGMSTYHDCISRKTHSKHCKANKKKKSLKEAKSEVFKGLAKGWQAPGKERRMREQLVKIKMKMEAHGHDFEQMHGMTTGGLRKEPEDPRREGVFACRKCRKRPWKKFGNKEAFDHFFEEPCQEYIWEEAEGHLAPAVTTWNQWLDKSQENEKALQEFFKMTEEEVKARRKTWLQTKRKHETENERQPKRRRS